MKTKFLTVLAMLTCATLVSAQTFNRIYVNITQGTASDQLRLLEAPSFTADFDNNYDVVKMMVNSDIYIYAMAPDQNSTSVAHSKVYTNDLHGLVLGYRATAAGTATISFSNLQSDLNDVNYYYIVDTEDNYAHHRITDGSFTFTAEAGDHPNRFLVAKPIHVEGSWAWSSWSTAFWSDNQGSVICTVDNLDANTEYEFGLHFADGSSSWTTNGYTYKSDYKSTANFVGGSAANMKLQTKAAGTYTFKWEYATRTFSIVFPTYTTSVTTNAQGLATFSYGSDLQAIGTTDVKLYKGAVSGENLDLTEVDYVKADEGVVVYGTANTTYYFNAGTGSSDFAGNELKAASTWVYPHAGFNTYVLSGSALYLYEEENMKPNKAFLKIAHSNNAPKRISMRFNSTTAVENVEVEAVKAEKFIEDGQVFIKRGEAVYNLQGQLVK